MSRRRTVEDWRREVYRASRVKPNARILLLYLADHMRDDRSVSIPQETISHDLGVSTRRIQERIADAHQAGFLGTKVAGRRGHTAVYEGLFP